MPPSCPLFPYTTLFRSFPLAQRAGDAAQETLLLGPLRLAALHLFTLLCRPPVQRRRASQAPRGFARFARASAFAARSRRTGGRSEEHTSELQSLRHLVCPLPVPSFPTRRSSDLFLSLNELVMLHKKRFSWGLFASQRFIYSRYYAGRRFNDAALPKRLAASLASLALPPLLLVRAVQAADRKSTRLNSSHLGTSYAPFLSPLSLHDALPIFSSRSTSW